MPLGPFLPISARFAKFKNQDTCMNYKIDMPKAYSLALHTTMLTISHHLAVRIEVIPFKYQPMWIEY